MPDSSNTTERRWRRSFQYAYSMLTPAPRYWQTPEQSPPPLLGSQVSFGSSTHACPLGHVVPASPPHAVSLAPALQMPEQSGALLGSQSSLGSSTHSDPSAHGSAPIPPHCVGAAPLSDLPPSLTCGVPASPVVLTVGWQMPLQSAPPLLGSQVSFGSSRQVFPVEHVLPDMPPHDSSAADVAEPWGGAGVAVDAQAASTTKRHPQALKFSCGLSSLLRVVRAS